MKKKETLADLTANMQSALIHCYGRGVKPHEFTDEGRWSPATLEALERNGLVQLVINRRLSPVWRPTELGRTLVCAHITVFLHRDPARNYTTRQQMAAWGEPEAA